MGSWLPWLTDVNHWVRQSIFAHTFTDFHKKWIEQFSVHDGLFARRKNSLLHMKNDRFIFIHLNLAAILIFALIRSRHPKWVTTYAIIHFPGKFFLLVSDKNCNLLSKITLAVFWTVLWLVRPPFLHRPASFLGRPLPPGEFVERLSWLSSYCNCNANKIKW